MGMDFVTQLTPIGKTRTRVCLNEEQTLVLSNREIMQYGIREGEELPEETMVALEKDLYQKAIEALGKTKDFTDIKALGACNMSPDEVLLAATCS